MNTQPVSIPLAKKDAVSGMLHHAAAGQPASGYAILLAHGAANDMHNPLIVHMSEGLAARGHTCLRFNFRYRDKQRKSPDTQKVLENTWLAVCDWFRTEYGRNDPLIAAGKSMGGRIAAQLAAEARLPVKRLVFYGYPLHAPGKPDQLRDAHLYHIEQPMLFFSGTRDPFCHLDKLQAVLAKLKASWQLETIVNGNHSFDLPQDNEQTRQATYATILQHSLDWLAADI
jgi:predicted alpha/beta-hydrolase family hydrolase